MRPTKRYLKPIIIFLLILILLPFLGISALYVYTKIEERNETQRLAQDLERFNTLPEISDKELVDRIVFSTDQLDLHEQEQIIDYLLENKRRVVIYAESIEFVSPEIKEGGFSNMCRNWDIPLTVLLIGRVKGIDGDVYKSGTIYMTRKPSESNWQECVTYIGPL